TFVKPQPVAGSHDGAVHALPSSAHTTGLPPPHAPAPHTLPIVHASPSSHAVPAATASVTQPSVGSQRSAVHGLPSSTHVVAIPSPQTPATQLVPIVQASTSSQLVPSATLVKPHPVPGSHDGAVHGLPSSAHEIATLEQPVSGTQESVVHALESSQSSAAPATHAPAPSQLSCPSQRSSSAQDVPTVAGIHAKR